MADYFDDAYTALTESLRATYTDEEYAREHGPMLVALDADASRRARVLPIPPGIGKDAVAGLHRFLAKNMPATVIAFVDEAWRASLSTTAEEDKRLAERIQDGRLKIADMVDKREEGILISLRMGDETRVGWCALDRKAKTLTGAPLLNPKAGEGKMSGRFA